MMKRAVSQLGGTVRRTLAQQSSNALRETSRRCYADDAANLKKTMLYDYHVENGGKMVPFAGWAMPIQYKDSIMDSTINCRTNGSLFDVSHMCGLSLKGPDAIDFLETLVVADIKGLANGTGTLSVFTNENGGVIDDTVITKVLCLRPHLTVTADILLKLLRRKYTSNSLRAIQSLESMGCSDEFLLSSLFEDFGSR